MSCKNWCVKTRVIHINPSFFLLQLVPELTGTYYRFLCLRIKTVFNFVHLPQIFHCFFAGFLIRICIKFLNQNPHFDSDPKFFFYLFHVKYTNFLIKSSSGSGSANISNPISGSANNSNPGSGSFQMK